MKDTVQRVYVRLRQTELDELNRVAQQERRHPADQAALILSRALHDRAAGRREPAQDAHMRSEDGAR